MSQTDSSYDGVWEESMSEEDELILENLDDESEKNKSCNCKCVRLKSFISHVLAFTFGVFLVLGYLMTYHGHLGYPFMKRQSVNQAQKHHSQKHRFIDTDRVNDKLYNWLNDKTNNKSEIIEGEVMTTIIKANAVIEQVTHEENQNAEEEEERRDETPTAADEPREGEIAPSAAMEPSVDNDFTEPSVDNDFTEPSAAQTPSMAQEPSSQA